MIEDNGEKRLIDKPVIVDLDESHHQYKQRAEKLYNGLMKGYLVLGLIWVLLTWKMYEIMKERWQIDGLIDNNAEINRHLINSYVRIDNNNNIGLISLFWWSLQLTTLMLIISLLLKYRKIVKQLNSKLITIIVSILAIAALFILKDFLAINIILSVSSRTSSLINTIQSTSTSQIQSTSKQLELFNSKLIKYESVCSFMYLINIVSLIINSILLTFLFYLYFKLYYSQQKCLSLINTLKTNNIFDIQSTISHQQISPQIRYISPQIQYISPQIQYMSPQIQYMSKQKQLKYIQSQQKLKTNSGKEIKQKQLSIKVNQIQMVNFRNRFQTNKQNPKVNTIQINTFNTIHQTAQNIKQQTTMNVRHQQLQPSHTQQSNNSIGQLHQIPQLTQYNKPSNKQTKTHQNIFYSTQQYPQLISKSSKSYNNIPNSENNKQYNYPTQFNM